MRVRHRAGSHSGPPLLLFNGIGGNVDTDCWNGTLNGLKSLQLP